MTTLAALSNPPSNLVGGVYHAIEGDSLQSFDPSQRGRVIWSGAPTIEHVDQAVAAARDALCTWSRWDIEKRAGVLLKYKALVQERAGDIVFQASRFQPVLQHRSGVERGELVQGGDQETGHGYRGG